MPQLLIAVAIIVVALVVAAVVRRRRPDAPSQPRAAVPSQLDRADFPHAERPWIVVVFSSATCSTCALVVSKAAVLESDQVAVTEVEYGDRRALHERYGIDSVPTLVMADAAGVVGRSFVGPVTATDLWAALAELRQPGSTPISHPPSDDP